MARQRNSRQARTTVFIACEGSRSEPTYLQALGENIPEELNLAITIYPDFHEKNPKTDPAGLLHIAREQAEIFDELWLVFDKDGYMLHEQVFEEAKKPVNGKIVHIAFSSIAFEHWVLLHFEQNKTAFSKSAEVIDHLERQGYTTGYEKKFTFNLYPLLSDKVGTMCYHTAWLRHEIQIGSTPVYELNPYTDLDHLIKRMQGITENIRWGRLNEVAETDTLALNVQKDEILHTFRVEFANKQTTSVVFNRENIANHFFLSDADFQPFPLQTNTTYHLPPETTQTLILTTKADPLPYFHFRQGNQQVVFSLRSP